jgi:hypothetical protein
MEELQDFTEEKESNFDLKAELYKYLGYWKWLLLGFIIGGLLAFLYNRYTIPQFRTEASVMILNEEKSNMANALPSGGGSILVGIDTIAEKMLKIKTRRADPFSKLETPHFLDKTLKQIGPEFAVSIGVALRRLQK